MTTNSRGWEIQQYTKAAGWVALTKPYATKAAAERAMKDMDNAFPYHARPRRVYEALA